ncbi:uncharacterized protein LOC101854876 [Aplysia californica]|uniref:Uncharacterized protein LOC101854876 n=1 Tax=Aplysia californica TaxID=6500 RepID=A0ABM0JU04_APLCA|nr:uncharacterized protein LOC101854876 [Aplysia californica]
MVNKFLVQMDNGYADHRDNSYMDIQHLAQQGEGPLSRHKRSITLPSNVTFDLVKEGVFQSQDTVGVGHRIQFKLDILFPAGDTDIQTFTPEFNLSGPDSLPVGGSGLYTFEMTLPFVKKNVQFDVFAPINATVFPAGT